VITTLINKPFSLIGGRNMNINTNASLDELLELWAKYAHQSFQRGLKSVEDVEDRNRIKSLLATKGIEHLEIGGITEDTFTVRYRNKYTWNTKDVPITN